MFRVKYNKFYAPANAALILNRIKLWNHNQVEFDVILRLKEVKRVFQSFFDLLRLSVFFLYVVRVYFHC